MKLALYSGNGFLNKIIKIVTRGKYNHSSFILSDDSVIEARPFVGVRKTKTIDIKDNKGYTIDIFDIPMDYTQECIVSDFLHKQINKPYDYWMALGFVLYDNRQGRKKYGKWFCSELNFAALEKINLLLLERTVPWKISPVNLSWSNKIIYNKTIQL